MTETSATFPYMSKQESTKTTSFKWQEANSEYEVSVAPLGWHVFTSHILNHCLDVRSKIESLVAMEAHVAPSLFEILPRTLPLNIRDFWEEIVEEVRPAYTTAGFDRCLEKFIEVNTSLDNQPW